MNTTINHGDIDRMNNAAAVTEAEAEELAKQAMREVDNLVLNANLDARTSLTVRTMLLSPSLLESEKCAIRTLLRRSAAT